MTAARCYLDPKVNDIPGVLDRLAAIQAEIGANGPGKPDGIGCFNTLYTDITKQVKAGVDGRVYPDNAFMAALDVAFANRYFDALRADAQTPGSAPMPWGVLLKSRADTKLFELQFAAAGVNAHIDFDLAAAVVEVWKGPCRGGPHDGIQHATYQQIDQVFAREMSKLRHKFEPKDLLQFDQGTVTKVLSFVSDWVVNLTRDLAWGHAARMWDLRHLGVDKLYMEALSLSAGEIGKGLLC